MTRCSPVWPCIRLVMPWSVAGEKIKTSKTCVLGNPSWRRIPQVRSGRSKLGAFTSRWIHTYYRGSCRAQNGLSIPTVSPWLQRRFCGLHGNRPSLLQLCANIEESACLSALGDPYNILIPGIVGLSLKRYFVRMTQYYGLCLCVSVRWCFFEFVW